MSDPVELVDLRRGDPAAWRLVHDQVLRAAGSFRSTLAGAWEDAVQEAQIRVLRAIRDQRVRPGSGLGPYVCRITRNVCIDELRRREVRAATPLEHMTEPPAPRAASPLMAVQRREQREHIERLLSVLSGSCRQLLWRLSQGMTYSELADQSGVSPGALRARAHRCRQQARVRLARMTTPIVAAGERLFLERGYIPTRMTDIAEAAGVGMAELEETYPDKPSVLWAIIHRMVAGTQGLSPEESDWVRPILAARDPHRRIVHATRVTADMYRRGLADLQAVVETAATQDAQYGELARRMSAAQSAVGLQIGRAIMNGIAPPEGQTIESLSEAATAIVSPDRYLPRTKERGWTEAEFWEWARKKVERVFLV